MAKYKFRIILLILLSFGLFSLPASADLTEDIDLHEKYQLYQKYQKKSKYGKYKKYVEVRDKYGFNDPTVRNTYKDYYEKYKQYKKQPLKYAAYARYAEQYKAYKKYQEVKEYKKYKNYKKYNNKRYDNGKKYGGAAYKAGSERYIAFTKDLASVTTNLGPEVRVGLWSYSKDDLIASNLEVSGSKAFNVTNCDSTIIGQVPTGSSVRVDYIEGGILRVYKTGVIVDTQVGDKICFLASDGNNNEMIFDLSRPNSNYDRYRGKIKVQHSNTSDNDAEEGSSRRIWVINMLPMEHYVWGFGEIGGGVDEHSKAMVVAARTYSRWYVEYSTKWTEEGFHLLSTSSSQIYNGYDYEVDHPSIADVARKTNGIIMKNQNNEIVLAAFSSWTDGKTRKYENGNWGRTYYDRTDGNESTSIYPELSAVDDPYGKHPYLSGRQLAEGCIACVNKQNYNGGNHMVGLSANGSLVLADKHGWTWTRILNYYYRKITILKEY